MPHNPNVNIDSIVDGIIKTDDVIDNLSKEIIKQINLLNEELYIFEKIDDMIKNFSEVQGKVFEYLYKDKMRITEVAYHIDRTERQVLNIKRYIFRKANFIQED